MQQSPNGKPPTENHTTQPTQKLRKIDTQANKLPNISVPNGDIFNSVDKGFVSFWRLEQTLSNDHHNHSHSRHNHSRLNSTRRVQTEHDEIAQTLLENRKKLDRLNNSIVTLRNIEYEEYIKSSQRYQKLLQLNNRRSRLATTKDNPNNKNKIGQIKVKQAELIKPQDMVYSLNLTKVLVKGWKPQSRQGQVCLSYKDYIVLIGGHNNTPLSSICLYSVQENAWVRTVHTQLQRSYHSALLYRHHYIVIFGGMGPPSGYLKDRQCLNSSCVFDISSNMFKLIKVGNEQIVQPRRHHSACIFGKYMVVFGGVDSRNRHLTDMKYLDLKELKWYGKEYKYAEEDIEIFMEKGISRHCMFSYFSQRQTLPFYSADYDDKEGLYIFGGSNRSGQSNLMMQLKLNRYTPILHRLEPGGLPPSSTDPMICRYNENCLLILSGERGERQLKIYRILSNEFVMVQNHMNLPSIGGVGSSLVPLRQNNTFYVMFGMGEKGFLSHVTSLQFTQKKKENPTRLRNKMIMEALRRYSVSESSGVVTVFNDP